MTILDSALLAAAALVLATMPIYGRRLRKEDPDMARRGATPLLGRFVRNWLVWAIGPLERAAVRRGIPPIAFNYAGLALAAAAGLAYALRSFPGAGVLLLSSGVMDVLDGRVARARHAVSRRGAFLDSTLDRFAELAIYLGLGLVFADGPLAVAATAAVMAAFGGSLMVSYARARAQSLGVDAAGGLLQRAERLVLLGGSSLLDPAAVAALGWRRGSLILGAVVVIAIGSLATAVGRVARTARELAAEDATQSGTGGEPRSVTRMEARRRNRKP